MTAATKLEIHPATADRWPDIVKLFGERGACVGCWCKKAGRSASRPIMRKALRAPRPARSRARKA